MTQFRGVEANLRSCCGNELSRIMEMETTKLLKIGAG